MNCTHDKGIPLFPDVNVQNFVNESVTFKTVTRKNFNGIYYSLIHAKTIHHGPIDGDGRFDVQLALSSFLKEVYFKDLLYVIDVDALKKVNDSNGLPAYSVSECQLPEVERVKSLLSNGNYFIS